MIPMLLIGPIWLVGNIAAAIALANDDDSEGFNTWSITFHDGEDLITVP